MCVSRPVDTPNTHPCYMLHTFPPNKYLDILLLIRQQYWPRQNFFCFFTQRHSFTTVTQFLYMYNSSYSTQLMQLNVTKQDSRKISSYVPRNPRFFVNNTPQTDVAPWCYKWIGYGLGMDWKSLQALILRAPLCGANKYNMLASFVVFEPECWTFKSDKSLPKYKQKIG